MLDGFYLSNYGKNDTLKQKSDGRDEALRSWFVFAPWPVRPRCGDDALRSRLEDRLRRSRCGGRLWSRVHRIFGWRDGERWPRRGNGEEERFRDGILSIRLKMLFREFWHSEMVCRCHFKKVVKIIYSITSCKFGNLIKPFRHVLLLESIIFEIQRSIGFWTATTFLVTFHKSKMIHNE